MHMVNDKGEAVYFNYVRKNNKDYEYDPAAKWWTARTRNGPRAIWCPYASPEAFLANWSPLEATVTVKRRL